MNVREFLQLEGEEQVRWIENLIMGQNPRLRIGERMTGPIGVFRHGKEYVLPKENPLDAFIDSPETVTVRTIALDSMALDGHPFLDIQVKDNNYLHIFTVDRSDPFQRYSQGDLLPVRFGDVQLSMPLTDELILKHTRILVRFALSK